jgi:hypothetical protein
MGSSINVVNAITGKQPKISVIKASIILADIIFWLKISKTAVHRKNGMA